MSKEVLDSFHFDKAPVSDGVTASGSNPILEADRLDERPDAEPLPSAEST